MRLFRPDEIIGIAEETLEFVLKASARAHPDEYMGFLRGEDAGTLGLDADGTVITEVLVVPGTESNPFSATVDTNMIPNDRRVAGSVHSHPNGVLRPSDADLGTFGRNSVHVIVGAPYGCDDWVAFDREGNETDLDVLDVDPAPEERFFDFTQADIDAELDAERSRDARGEADGTEEAPGGKRRDPDRERGRRYD